MVLCFKQFWVSVFQCNVSIPVVLPTPAEPPCCWRSGSERVRRWSQLTGRPQHKTGPPETRAVGASWEEAKPWELSRWTPSQGPWSWAGAQTEVWLPGCHWLIPVWRNWLEWRENLAHRSPRKKKKLNQISLCSGCGVKLQTSRRRPYISDLLSL